MTEQTRKELEEQATKLYGNLVYPKTHIELYVDGYLAGAKELENQIADIKANCDLAIEGRDIKIKELELELTVQKDQLQEETNLHLHAEEYIKSLEQQIEKMKCGQNCKFEYWINTGGCYDQKCRFTGLDCTNCKDKWKGKWEND